jgi:hypothetical protein
MEPFFLLVCGPDSSQISTNFRWIIWIQTNADQIAWIRELGGTGRNTHYTSRWASVLPCGRQAQLARRAGTMHASAAAGQAWFGGGSWGSGLGARELRRKTAGREGKKKVIAFFLLEKKGYCWPCMVLMGPFYSLCYLPCVLDLVKVKLYQILPNV